MFTLEDGTLKIRPEDLLLASFMEAYAQDTSTHKDEVLKLFSYIHLVAQVDSKAPFFRVSSYEIKPICKREIYRDEHYDWSDSIYNEIQVEEMVKEYVLACSTPEDRILKAYDKKVDEYEQMLEKNKPTIKENLNEKTGAVSFSTNQKILADALTGIEAIIQARDNLVAKIKRQTEKGTVRGQQAPSLLEKKHATK